MRENTIESGAKKLYEEDITSSSPTLDIFKPLGLNILGRILKGIGIAIDRGIDVIGLGGYFPTGEQGVQPANAYKASYRMASGYRTAMQPATIASIYNAHEMDMPVSSVIKIHGRQYCKNAA